MSNGCSETLHVSIADAYRSLALAMFGMSAKDRIQTAEMSVSNSIGELVAAEEKTTRELSLLVNRVRSLDAKKQRNQVQELLGRTRVLRNSLASISKKRAGMEQNLETLRQSQLNQNMLQSMKHTTDALQTLGFKVQDADSVLLDLEDVTSDTNALQSALSMGFDTDWSLEDLDAELELVLSDDALCASVSKPKARPAEDGLLPAQTEVKDKRGEASEAGKDGEACEAAEAAEAGEAGEAGQAASVLR
jgi:hypothetical protein